MLKKIGFILGALTVIVAIAAYIAPKETKIERSIVINQPKDILFQQLVLLKNHDAWMPWGKKDPHMKKTFTGTDGTVGFISAWSGNKEVGVGEQEITAIIPGERIEYELRFKEPMEGLSKAFLSTTALSDTQTKVVWGFETKNKFPGTIICMVLNMEQMLTDEFDSGLQALKAQSETAPSK